MRDDTTMAAPALGMPVDGLGEVVRQAVRGAIEAAVESELTLALGRAAWERATTATGYRHGTVPRTLVTSAGPVALTLPRGRLQQPDGRTQEWRSGVLPRYARRTVALDTTLARLYLSGASTRDLRRAVADESIVCLYLDGQRHRVRAAGHVTWCSVLMAVGVRRTGEKVVLALRVVGGEQTAAWAQLLEDLTARGLGRPELVISDGSKGAAAALEATWSGLAHQRCLVHKLRNLIATVPRPLRAAVVRDFRTITAAATSAAVQAARAAFRRTWALQWSAVVVSLDEAGAGLTAGLLGRQGAMFAQLEAFGEAPAPEARDTILDDVGLLPGWSHLKAEAGKFSIPQEDVPITGLRRVDDSFGDPLDWHEVPLQAVPISVQ